MATGPYKMGTIARLSGFSPDVLRAWERRYGLLSPERGPGGQRLYSDADLATLRRVKAHLAAGRAIGEIVAAGRTSAAVPALSRGGADGPVAAWRAAILDAALAMDSSVISATLDEAFATVGASRTVHEVIEPSARTIGDAWAAGTCTVASEHLASNIFTHRVRRLLDDAQPAAAGAPRLVAGCFPDEDHQLGLLVLSWHLARHGFRVDYLGPSVPMSNLPEACRASSARAVLLSVTRAPVYRRHRRELSALVGSREFTTPVILGGQGVPEKHDSLKHLKVIRGDVTSDVESAILNLVNR